MVKCLKCTLIEEVKGECWHLVLEQKTTPIAGAQPQTQPVRAEDEPPPTAERGPWPRSVRPRNVQATERLARPRGSHAAGWPGQLVPSIQPPQCHGCSAVATSSPPGPPGIFQGRLQTPAATHGSWCVLEPPRPRPSWVTLHLSWRRRPKRTCPTPHACSRLGPVLLSTRVSSPCTAPLMPPSSRDLQPGGTPTWGCSRTQQAEARVLPTLRMHGRGPQPAGRRESPTLRACRGPRPRAQQGFSADISQGLFQDDRNAPQPKVSAGCLTEQAQQAEQGRLSDKHFLLSNIFGKCRTTLAGGFLSYRTYRGFKMLKRIVGSPRGLDNRQSFPDFPHGPRAPCVSDPWAARLEVGGEPATTLWPSRLSLLSTCSLSCDPHHSHNFSSMISSKILS